MPFDARFLDELRAAVRCSDVVGRKLRLKREGSEYVVVGDPSFHVSDKKQRWFDNGSANIDGDVFEFLVRFEGMSFFDAVAEIARMAGVRLPGEIREPARHDAGNGAKKQPAPSRGPKRVIGATYDYTDGNGFLQYQVVRYEPKDFRQRRPQRADDDPRKVDADGFVWNLDGVEHTLYRLPALLRDMREPREEQRTWLITEGEKDCHTLLEWNMAATTNSGGAEHFTEAMAERFRDARDVVIVEDNDDAGAKRTAKIAPMLQAAGAYVRSLAIAKFWPECPDKGDITDWRDKGGGTADKLFQILDRLPGWAPEPYKSKYGARMFGELAHSEPIAYEWAIRGLIPRRENTLIIGPSRSGKTFATLDLAMHIARGLPYMGRRAVHGGVIYLSYEGQVGFENRLRAYCLYHGLNSTDESIPFGWLVRPPGLFASEDNAVSLGKDVRELTRGWPVPVAAVIVDTHNSATRGSSEIRSEDISRILDRYDCVARESGAPLWIVGHTNAEGLHRGNQQMFNRIETTLLVERVMEGRGKSAVPVRSEGRILRRIVIEKQREGEDGIEWQFILQHVKVGEGDDGDITSMVPLILDSDGGEAAPDEPLAPVGKGAYWMHESEERFFRALLAAIAERGVPPPPSLGLPASIPLVATWPDIIAVFENKEPLQDNTPEGRKRRRNMIAREMKKPREKLGYAHAIGIKSVGSDSLGEAPVHYVWPTGRAVFRGHYRWPRPPEAVVAAQPAAAEQSNIIDMATGKPIDSLDDKW
jgi:hypothetical protein